jgi:hypothetical protein
MKRWMDLFASRAPICTIQTAARVVMVRYSRARSIQAAIYSGLRSIFAILVVAVEVAGWHGFR